MGQRSSVRHRSIAVACALATCAAFLLLAAGPSGAASLLGPRPLTYTAFPPPDRGWRQARF